MGVRLGRDVGDAGVVDLDARQDDGVVLRPEGEPSVGGEGGGVGDVEDFLVVEPGLVARAGSAELEGIPGAMDGAAAGVPFEGDGAGLGGVEASAWDELAGCLGEDVAASAELGPGFGPLRVPGGDDEVVAGEEVVSVGLEGEVDVADARVAHACVLLEVALAHSHAGEALDGEVAVEGEFAPERGGAEGLAVHVGPSRVAGEAVGDFPGAERGPVVFGAFEEVVADVFAAEVDVDEVDGLVEGDGAGASGEGLWVEGGEDGLPLVFEPEEMSVAMEGDGAPGAGVRGARAGADFLVDDLGSGKDAELESGEGGGGEGASGAGEGDGGGSLVGVEVGFELVAVLVVGDVAAEAVAEPVEEGRLEREGAVDVSGEEEGGGQGLGGGVEASPDIA